MNKFKIGDIVIVNLNNLVSINGWYCFIENKERYTRFKSTLRIISDDCGSEYPYRCVPVSSNSNGDNICLHGDELILVGGGFGEFNNKNNNKIMSNLTSMFKNLVRSEPEKTFVKCGIMNESLDLTTEGKELFTNFLFEKNKSEFKTEVVDKIVAEQEKK